MNDDELGMLCHNLLRTEEGKRLIKGLKERMYKPILPQPKNLLETFGGAEMYAAHRSGQIHVLSMIEVYAKGFQQREVMKIEKGK